MTILSKTLSFSAMAIASFSVLTTTVYAQDAEEVRIEKINTYIDCFNGATERAMDSINRYQSWVQDMEVGPTGKEANVYGLYTLHDYAVQACQDNVPAAIALEPAIEKLDSAAQNYLDALLPLNEKINEASKYYERENYKDDDFAKGKEMHPALAEAMQQYIEASDALSDAIDAETSGDGAKMLAQIEAEYGKNYDYWSLATILDAQELVEIMAEDEFDAAAVAPMVESYENNADALLEYAEAHEDEKPMSAAFFLPAVDNFRNAAKQRLRRVRDKTPYTKGEEMNLNHSAGWMVDGSTYKVIDSYNKLVDASNK